MDKKRGGWRFHLSTAVVMMITAGALLPVLIWGMRTGSPQLGNIINLFVYGTLFAGAIAESYAQSKKSD